MNEYTKWMEESGLRKSEKRKIKEFLEENAIGYDTIDWKSIDRGNDFAGVKDFLKEQYGLTIPPDGKEGKELIEKSKADEQERIRKEEAELLDNWKKEKEGVVIDVDSFKMPRQLIDMTCKGYSNGCILVGSGGLGKSYLTLDVVKRSGRKFVYLNTHITPLAMYKLLYQHSEEIIICDDLKGVISNEICLAILKGALDAK